MKDLDKGIAKPRKQKKKEPTLIASKPNLYWLYDLHDGTYGLGIFDPGGSRTLPPMSMEEVLHEIWRYIHLYPDWFRI